MRCCFARQVTLQVWKTYTRKKPFSFRERERERERERASESGATSGTQLLGVMHSYNINVISSRERLSALQLMRKPSIIPLPSAPCSVQAPLNDVKSLANPMVP
jgi:hypothetical protein